jgi:hypothetical protein
MRTMSIQVLTAAALLAPAAWRGGGSHGAPGSARGAAGAATVITVTNLRDKGVVHSGFLVGTAASSGSSSVTLVEVSLDGGATFQPATIATGSDDNTVLSPAAGTTNLNWKFKFPTGTAGWKDNSAHTVDVRATDSDGNVTQIPTLSVRKGANQDVDGDGFADVLVGAPAFDNDRGRVYLFYSSKDGSGVPSTGDANNLDDPNVKVIGGEIGAGPQAFGASTAMADVNGDGFADLIVGAPASLDGAGHLYVFYAIEVAPGSALVVQGNATGTSTQLSGDDDRFLGLGTSVAAGDVNGDGVADVVAGAPGTANTPEGEPGRVYVFHALPASPEDPAQGLIPATVFGANATIIAATAGSDFGRAVAIGDVNGDGFADVIAGATLAAGTRGEVYVFHAAADGRGVPTTFTGTFGEPETSTNAANTLIVGEVTSHIGASLAVGDLNGDGFVDVVTGGPSFSDASNPNRGRVYVFYSAGHNGVPTKPIIDENDNTPGQHVIGGEFGAGPQLFGTSVAVADVNGDGTADLIVGAPAALGGAGVAYVFHSTPGSGLAQGNAINARAAGTQINGVGSITSAFGTSVSAGDVNGDGVADVFAGAAGSETLAGRAFVFRAIAGQGVPGGINGTIRILDATTTLVGAVNSFFASSIAR